MIPFIYSKVRFKSIRIKKVSGVQEGRVTYLDPVRSVNGKEVFSNEKVPGHVSNAFGRGGKLTKKTANGELKEKTQIMRAFLKPVVGSIGYYDGLPITLERHPLGNLGDADEATWTSYAQDAMEAVIKPLTKTGKWYIDGSYIYRLDDENPETWQRVTKDGRFRQVNTTAIRILDLSRRGDKIKKADELLHQRVCIAYVSSSGKYVVSPPIWKDLGTIGKRIKETQISDVDVEDDRSVMSLRTAVETDLLDNINAHVCVNLSFVLKAGKSLANVFGYDAIEPLNLPELMLKLKTVNLPNVHHAVKSTYNSGVPFLHMTAWLLGLLGHTNTLPAYLTVRGLLKYLSGKGLYFQEGLSDIHIFKKGYDVTNVPLKTIEEAKVIPTTVAQALTDDDILDSITDVDYQERMEDHMVLDFA